MVVWFFVLDLTLKLTKNRCAYLVSELKLSVSVMRSDNLFIDKNCSLGAPVFFVVECENSRQVKSLVLNRPRFLGYLYMCQSNIYGEQTVSAAHSVFVSNFLYSSCSK